MRLLREPWRRLIELDARSLALMRVGLAALVLTDLILRLEGFASFYTEAGVLPLEVWRPLAHHETLFSLYSWSEAAWWPVVLFAVAAGCAVAMLVGYQTRLATIASWVLCLSLQNRNPFICYTGDALLRLALFWAMFLPLGAVWSLDARRRLTAPVSLMVSSAGTVGLWGLLLSVFVFLFDHKVLGHDWTDGSATYWALSVGWYSRVLGTWLTGFPRGLMLATWLTLGAQIAVPLLILSPVRVAASRTAAVALVLAQQIVFGLSMWLGLFPFITTAVFAALLPGALWDRLGLGLQAPPQRPGAATIPGRLPLWARTLATAAMVLSLFWNLGEAGIELDVPPSVTRAFAWAVKAPRLDQRWSMFSPNVQREDGWFELDLSMESGPGRDLWPLLSGEPSHPSPRVPGVTSTRFASHRWLMAMIELSQAPTQAQGDGMLAFACGPWNAQHHGADAALGMRIVYESFDHLTAQGAGAAHRSIVFEGRCPQTHQLH